MRLRLVDPAGKALAERIARLADEELRMLAAGVGDHLPIELVERAIVVRAERQRLELLG
jgi:hypothetical protein